MKLTYKWTADVVDHNAETTEPATGTVTASAYSPQSRTEAQAAVRGLYRGTNCTPTNIKLTVDE